MNEFAGYIDNIIKGIYNGSYPLVFTTEKVNLETLEEKINFIYKKGLFDVETYKKIQQFLNNELSVDDVTTLMDLVKEISDMNNTKTL